MLEYICSLDLFSALKINVAKSMFCVNQNRSYSTSDVLPLMRNSYVKTDIFFKMAALNSVLLSKECKLPLSRASLCGTPGLFWPLDFQEALITGFLTTRLI